MIAELNRLIEFVEAHLSDDLDVAALANTLGTTEYDLRRMTVAAAEVIAGAPVLDVAVQFGYGSAEAFGRAFRAVHGVATAEVRNDGGLLRSQPQLRLRLTIEGNTSMDTRITDRPAFRLVGHAVRVPLIHEGRNPHIEAHIASLPADEHARLKELGNAEPVGLLQVSADVGPDYAEGRRAHLPARCRSRCGDGCARRPRRGRGPGRLVGGVPHQRTLSSDVAGDVRGITLRVVPLEPVETPPRPLDRRSPRSRRGFQHRDRRALGADRARLAQHARPSRSRECAVRRSGRGLSKQP